MPKRRYLNLTVEQAAALKEIRDHHQKPYLREKAGALLKIASGQSAHDVALNGLLKPRSPDTLYRWLSAYEKNGIDSLYIRSGRGRKAAFFP